VDKDMIRQTLGDKLKDTKRQRPTIIQQYDLVMQGVDELVSKGSQASRKDLIEEVVATFNATQGDVDCMLSRAEIEGIKMLEDQLPEFKDRLRRHWATYLVELSAIPRKLLSLRCLRSGGDAPVTRAENEAWYLIYTRDLCEKNVLFLRRLIQAFQSRISTKDWSVAHCSLRIAGVLIWFRRVSSRCNENPTP
jgi:hypothetical protein